MGTRSDIIVHRADDSWARIYCHWDGYPEHNGRILYNHYKTQAKCDKLVALGDISSLAPAIGRKHNFDWRMDAMRKGVDAEKSPFANMVNAYGRDRGETEVNAVIGNSLAAVWPGVEAGTEFTYVFYDPDGRGRRWFVGDPDEGSQTLRALGAVLQGEVDAPKTAIKAFGGNFVIGRRA